MQTNNEEQIYLIHGWGFDSRVMNDCILLLEKKYRTSLLDMPGYGPARTQEVPKDIDSMTDALIRKITPGCILAGWSLGGMIAIRMAGRLKNKIRAIVLIASTPCFSKKDGWPHGVEKTLIEKMQQRITNGETEKVLKEFALLIAKGDVNSRKIAKKLYSMAQNRLPDVDVLNNGLDILMNVDLRNDIAQLECPVVLFLADNDHLVANETGEAMKSICKDLHVVHMDSAGHAPFISRPDEFCSQLNAGLMAL